MYRQLVEWHQSFGKRIEILLYPSMEFGAQEYSDISEVARFVKQQGLPTGGGGCTLMKHVKVNGAAADPLWKMAKARFVTSGQS